MLAQDIEDMLTPSTVGEWEFALSGAEQAVEFVGMNVCPGCGGNHARLLFESLEKRESGQDPERSWVLEMIKDKGGDFIVQVHVYDDGEQIAGCFVRPSSVSNFMRNYSEAVAESVFPLRAMAKSVPAKAMVH